MDAYQVVILAGLLAVAGYVLFWLGELGSLIGEILGAVVEDFIVGD